MIEVLDAKIWLVKENILERIYYLTLMDLIIMVEWWLIV